jgi:DNA-directed RNA polymerase subunit RPC12/RpoP
MLVLKCAACKKKLWRYDKIGPGEVLRCHKNRIIKIYASIKEDNKIKCLCGKDIGIDKGTYIKMILKAFTYSGTKRNK